MILSELEVREAFHCHLLANLPSDYRDPPSGAPALRLKGGVNLRLFLGSPRYSEDIDFDLAPKRGPKFLNHLKQLLADSRFLAELLELGITDLSINKIHGGRGDSHGFRQKLTLTHGGVKYATKIEVSYREETPAGDAKCLPIPDRFCQRYGVVSGVRVAAYPKMVAAMHKVLALSRRDPPQTRDAFDFDHLIHDSDPELADAARRLVQTRMTVAQVLAAAETVAALDHASFKFQVAEYLPDTLRNDAIAAWEAQRERTWIWLEQLGHEMGEAHAVPPGSA